MNASIGFTPAMGGASRTGGRNAHQSLEGFAVAAVAAAAPSQTAPESIQSLMILISASLSRDPNGIDGWSCPVRRRYNGLLAASPGTIAGPFFCPPCTAAAREL